MAATITREQLNKLLEGIATSHWQVHTYGWGDVPDLLAREDVIYPFMMVTPQASVYGDNTINHTYTISIADRVLKDKENEVAVDSDTHQILMDVVTQLDNLLYDDVDLIKGITVTPFFDNFRHEVTGHFANVTVQVMYNYDACAIPSDNVVLPLPPPSDCLPASYRVQYEDGTLIEEGTIPSGGSVIVDVPNITPCENATWELRDSAGVLIDSGSIVSGGSETITAPDGVVTITDSAAATLYVVNVKSDGTATQAIGDSVVTLKDTDGVTLSTTNIKAEASEDITAPDANLSLNGFAYPPLKSGSSINLAIEDTLGGAVGSFSIVTDSWVIGDSTVNVNKSDGTLISAVTVEAEGSVGFNVADSAIRLEDSAAGLISNTNVKATDPATIVAPDGTVNVNKSDGALISSEVVKSNETKGFNVADSVVTNDAVSPTYTQQIKATENLVLPTQQINVNSVNEGAINSVGAIDINLNVTPNSVGIAGRTVTIDVPSGGGTYDLDLVDRFGNAFPTQQVTANATWDLRTLTPFDWADLFLNALTGTLTTPQEQAVIDFVSDQFTSGIWQKRITIHPFIGGNAADHSLNLRYPFAGALNSQSLSFFGSPTHDANGVTFGSTSMAYLKENASWLQKTDFNLFFYNRSNTTPASGLILDVRAQIFDGTARFFLGARSSDGNSYWGAGALNTAANADPRGGYHGDSRGLLSPIVKNGTTVLGTLTSIDYSGENLSPICLGGQLSNYRATAMSLGTERNYAGFATGFSLTDTQIEDDYTQWQALNTAFSRQV